MRITQLPTPAPGPAKPPLPHAPGQPPMPAEEVADVYGDKVSVFQFGDDGKLRPKEGLQAPRSDSRLSRLKEVFVPSNMPNSVSKDYLPTRGWQFVRDVFSNAAGSATAAGVLAVFGLNPGWALLQAGVSIVAGAIMLFNPFAGAVSLTLVLGIFLLAGGVFQAVIAWRLRPMT